MKRSVFDQLTQTWVLVEDPPSQITNVKNVENVETIENVVDITGSVKITEPVTVSGISVGSVDQGAAGDNTDPWYFAVTNTSNVVVKPGDSSNNAIRVNVVAGGAGGGTAQLAVKDSGGSWVDVGFGASQLYVPVTGSVRLVETGSIKIAEALPAGSNTIGSVTQGAAPWSVTFDANYTGSINLQKYLGSTVGATNAVHVQPGTGAKFEVTGTVAALQSGSWTLTTSTDPNYTGSINIQNYQGNAVGDTNAIHVRPGIGAKFEVTGTIAALQSGSWTVAITTGSIDKLATEDTLGTMSGKFPTSLGQKSSAFSFAVVPASDHTGSINIQKYIGADAGPGNGFYVRPGTSAQFEITGTIAALQSGSWTAAITTGSIDQLATENTLGTMSGKLPTSLGQKVSAFSFAVVPASDYTGSVNVSSWLGSTGPTVGQKVEANSIPVVLASDRTPPINLAQVNGTSMALNNPVITRLTDGTNYFVPASGSQLPTTLGQKTGTNSLSVVLSSDVTSSVQGAQQIGATVASSPFLIGAANPSNAVGVLTADTIGRLNVRIGEGLLTTGVVDETGSSAVDALAVGGGTPHDSIDSGNPVKVGVKASTSLPTAVANGDRANAIGDVYGRQMTTHIDPTMQFFTTGSFTTSQTGTSLKVPTAGKKLAITSVTISTYGTTAGRAILWFGSSVDTTFSVGDQPVFIGSFAPSATSNPGAVLTPQVPIFSSTADYYLRLTTSANLSIDVVVYGYEF